MKTYVALLRGINVGRAKTVAMAELAVVFRELGFLDVRTILRSGNVVFRSAAILSGDAPATIEAAVDAATGVHSRVLIFDAGRFAAIVAANPLIDIALDGSKSFVTFVAAIPHPLVEPDVRSLAPEVLTVGSAAVYQWMPDGSLRTKVPPSFWKQFPEPVTTRNWNTVLKLRALIAGREPSL